MPPALRRPLLLHDARSSGVGVGRFMPIPLELSADEWAVWLVCELASFEFSECSDALDVLVDPLRLESAP